MGILLVGMGAVSTTTIAGVLAVRRGLAKPIGSLTQMGTVRLGKRTEGRSPQIKDFVPLASLDDVVFGGWDIFEDDAYAAAKTAGVLDDELLDQVRPDLEAIKPMPAELVGQAVKFMQSLYSAYEQMDASLMEINPFLLTKDNRLIALDAKVNFDDNALFRHKEFLDLRDLNEEEPLEIEASKFDLNYIKLDGNIACMVNGAGLAMATMDIIKLAGGEPANFLDVGGGASQERVEAAFRILLADENVKAVLINIFGGIVRCDMVARGVVEAARNLKIEVPVVVRLEGTNVEEGQRVIRESGMNFTVATGMQDAAEKVVRLAA